MPSRASIRDFVARRWDLVAQEKLRFLGDRYQAGGPAAARLRALRLAERFRKLHPGGPSDDARRRDLAAHVALKALLGRTADVVRRR